MEKIPTQVYLENHLDRLWRLYSGLHRRLLYDERIGWFDVERTEYGPKIVIKLKEGSHDISAK